MMFKRYALGAMWCAAMLALMSCGGIKIEPCPSGHTGVKPFCVPDQPPPPAACSAGFHGTPPDCVKDEPPVERTPLCDSLAGHLDELCWSFPPKPDGTAGDHFVWVCKGARSTVLDPVDCPAAPAHPPVAAGCKFPQGLPESAFRYDPLARNTVGDAVNQAADSVLQGHADVWGGVQPFFLRLAAELRARGFCAGQHVDGFKRPDGVWERGSSDEIAVRAKDADGKPTGPWQAFHSYQGPDANLETDHGKYLRSPESFRGAYTVEDPGAGVPPVSASCPLPLDFDVAEPITRWASVVVEPIAGLAGQWSIKTAWCSKRDTDDHKPGVGPGGQPIQALAPAGWGAPCGTQCCRVGIHEAAVGLACERAILGDPLWVTSDGVTRGHTDNPFNFKVAGVSGTGQWIKACGSAGHACSAPVPVQ